MTRLRRLVVAAGFCAVYGLVSASASLMPVSSAGLGAGDGIVSPCGTGGVTVSYTSAFDATVADYRTTAVTVAGLAPACVGQSLKVTVRAATGASLFQGSATVAGSSATIAATPFTSSAVAGWAVTVTG